MTDKKLDQPGPVEKGTISVRKRTQTLEKRQEMLTLLKLVICGHVKLVKIVVIFVKMITRTSNLSLIIGSEKINKSDKYELQLAKI